MKVKTNFKQMYLVDTLLYNKLSLDPSVGWINQTPMNPNIHIHNKHTPPPSTPPAPSRPLPGPPPQLAQTTYTTYTANISNNS